MLDPLVSPSVYAESEKDFDQIPRDFEDGKGGYQENRGGYGYDDQSSWQQNYQNSGQYGNDSYDQKNDYSGYPQNADSGHYGGDDGYSGYGHSGGYHPRSGENIFYLYLAFFYFSHGCKQKKTFLMICVDKHRQENDHSGYPQNDDSGYGYSGYGGYHPRNDENDRYEAGRYDGYLNQSGQNAEHSGRSKYEAYLQSKKTSPRSGKTFFICIWHFFIFPMGANKKNISYDLRRQTSSSETYPWQKIHLQRVVWECRRLASGKLPLSQHQTNLSNNPQIPSPN